MLVLPAVLRLVCRVPHMAFAILHSIMKEKLSKWH